MVKLPWTAAREAEAHSWAERCFAPTAPACAVRVGHVLSESLGIDLEQLPAQQLLTDEATFAELHRVELFLALEREFGVSISDADAESMKTPAGIVSFIERRGATR